MPPKSNVPIRICGSKTRSGCKTCKQRHVKCDEQKPVCSKCHKGNRRCIYEDTQVLLAQKGTISHGLFTPGLLHVLRSSRSETLNISINPYGPYDSSNIDAVKHFGSRLGRELAGGFSDEIWCNVIPRIAQYESSIWHAMTAIGLLDQSVRRGTATDISTSIKHYGKAIRELHLRLSSPADSSRQDVILLSCLLLAIYECLQNNMHSALRHIAGGMKLLREWQNKDHDASTPGRDGYFNRKSLLPIFLSLDSQAIQMGAITSRNYGALAIIDEVLQGNVTFGSIEEAHLSLNHIFNRISHWAVWVEPSVGYGVKPSQGWMATEKRAIQNQFTKWDQAFEHFLAKGQAQPSTFLLVAQRKILTAFFGKELDGISELEWDKYFPSFLEAVENAEVYMTLTMKDFEPYHISPRLWTLLAFPPIRHPSLPCQWILCYPCF